MKTIKSIPLRLLFLTLGVLIIPLSFAFESRNPISDWMNQNLSGVIRGIGFLVFLVFGMIFKISAFIIGATCAIKTINIEKKFSRILFEDILSPQEKTP
jgi:hypothetical protein